MESITKDVWTNSIGMEFVTIPADSFMMGREDHYRDPVYRVSLSVYQIQTAEVTQGQWLAVVGSTLVENMAITKADKRDIFSSPPGRRLFPGQGSTYPMYYVNWYDAIVFCNKLSLREGLTPVYHINGSTNPDHWGAIPFHDWFERRTRGGDPATWDEVIADWNADGYRLPTEAEWEFAARGGGHSQDYVYAGSNNLDLVAWHRDNSGGTTHPVGQKQPNELGLFDMTGNVSEWCWDWFGRYTSEEKNNPRGPVQRNYKVVRGGCWLIDRMLLPYTTRIFSGKAIRNHLIGFTSGVKDLWLLFSGPVWERFAAKPTQEYSSRNLLPSTPGGSMIARRIVAPGRTSWSFAGTMTTSV